jgi:hypothetical protein
MRRVAEAKLRPSNALAELSPALQRLAEALEANAILRQYFTRMVEGANEIVFTLAMADPDAYREFWTEDGDFMTLSKSNAQVLELMSVIILAAPQYNETQMVGTPLNGCFACACRRRKGRRFSTMLNSACANTSHLFLPSHPRNRGVDPYVRLCRGARFLTIELEV